MPIRIRRKEPNRTVAYTLQVAEISRGEAQTQLPPLLGCWAHDDLATCVALLQNCKRIANLLDIQPDEGVCDGRLELAGVHVACDAGKPVGVRHDR